MPISRRVPLLLLAVALATRWLALGNPILHVDEQYYLAVGRAWAAGRLPYVDLWDRKPIGLFLIYRLVGALPLMVSIWAYQLLALASAWATALIAAAMAGRSGLARTGAVAGVLYLVWIVLAEGQGGQSPVFYNLFVAAAFLLVLEDGRSPGLTAPRALAAMLLIGLAMQIKTSVVFEGIFLGCWIVWRRWRLGSGWGQVLALAAAMVTLALLPTALAAYGYDAIDHWHDWWFANVESIAHRQPDPAAEQIGNLVGLIALISPLVAMAVVALIRARKVPLVARQLLAGWLAVSCLAVLGFGSWFDHYALPIMVPASIAAAGLFESRARRWPVIALVVAAIGGQALLIEKLCRRGTAAAFDRVVQAVGEGPGCLFVYNGDPMLYAAVRRCTLTRFQFPTHLTRARENGAIGVDQAAELARVLALKPAVIVDTGPFRGELPDRRRQLQRALARGYYPSARVAEGFTTITVYRRTP